MTRRTSIYALVIPAPLEVDALLASMKAIVDEEPDVQRAGCWAEDGDAVVLFRASDDTTATAVARKAGLTIEGATLSTGTGVHRRMVAPATTN